MAGSWASTSPSSGLFHALRQMVALRQRREFGDGPVEGQFDRAGRAVTLLADDDLGLAAVFFGVRHPGAELLAVALQRLSHHVVIFFAIDEQHDVGVLL